MKTILLSIAHAADCSDATDLIANGRFPKGATNNTYNEYDFSVAISGAIYRALANLGVPVEIFDASEGHTDLTYGEIYQHKINWANARSYSIGPANCLAVEIHHNSVNASGYSCHYCAGSKAGRQAAETVCAAFAAHEWSYPHWPKYPKPPALPGVVERPGKYGGGVDFLSQTICPAIIIEAEGMGNAAWVAENLQREAEIIREALCRMVAK